MCEFDTEEKQQSNWFDDERQRKMCYWGFKFETYITSGSLFVLICFKYILKIYI